MDITGKWTYREDFDYGKSVGEVDFIQAENEVIGLFTFTESVDGFYTVEVSEKVKGTIKDGTVLLESFEVEAMENNTKADYYPNTFDVQLIAASKMVGSTFDNDSVCGVFVLERKS